MCQGNCKKGLTRAGGNFWCESCECICEFLVIRYRLHMDVTDGDTSLVVTVFDDMAEMLIRKKASILMEELGAEAAEGVVPHEIMLLVNTRHVLELKSHTHYNHGIYESFTVSRIIDATPPSVEKDTDPCDSKVEKGIATEIDAQAGEVSEVNMMEKQLHNIVEGDGGEKEGSTNQGIQEAKAVDEVMEADVEDSVGDLPTIEYGISKCRKFVDDGSAEG